jgi:hypothetical protein
MAQAVMANGVKERRHMVRSRTFSADTESVMLALRTERFTGRVTIDMTQGGIQQVLVEDRTALPFLAANNNHA